MRYVVVHLIFVGLLGLAAFPAGALNPNLPPGTNFVLNHWYLQLPTSNGILTHASGTVDSVSTSQLMAGFTNAYFYTGADGAMVFWAPVTGATTSGSTYPRSELRELLKTNDGSVDWSLYGTHILDAQCKVLQVPSTGNVIIGQIHGYTGAALPLVKVEYESGTVYVLVKTNANNDNSDFSFKYANVGLSNAITYQINVLNGLISIAVNGVTNSMNVFQTDPNWATNTAYFKAGDYCQDNVGTDSEGARIAFYAVSLYHAPAITNQPASTNVTTGQKATFTVAASGNGTLTNQWWRNATTKIVGATNASLTITNVNSTNAGNYTVVVSDYTGSVTSSVATLTVNKATPTLTAPTATSITYGQTLTNSTLSGGAATNAANNALVAGSFAFTTPTTAPGAGTAPQSVTFTPIDTTNYTTATTSVSVTVARAGLTVQGITANNKTYDGNTTATLNTAGASLAGNLDGTNVLLSTAGATGAFTPNGNIGIGKTVQVSGLTISGAATNNYTLAQPTTSANIIAPPATVSSFANGVMNINFFGIPNSNYVVLTTTNLGMSWWPLRTNTADSNSTWLFSDSNATNVQQFYRVVTP